MPETYKKMIPIEVSYVCDTCNIGTMNPTGAGLITNQLTNGKWLHECSNCGTRVPFDRNYPYIKFEPL